MYEDLVKRLHQRIALTTAGSPLQDDLREAADAIHQLSHHANNRPIAGYWAYAIERYQRRRLTWRRVDGAVCPRVEKGTDYNYILGEFTQKVYDKLAAYEDAEEQGRLVVLPVKAGDTVYQLRDKKHALGVGVHPRHISCVCVYGNDWIAEHQGDKPCAKKDLGKTWFLSREEAEAALKGERKDV